jgi:hypothetical protein
MKRFIISAFIAALLSISLTPAFAAPYQHNLNSPDGYKKFWDEQSDRKGG